MNGIISLANPLLQWLIPLILLNNYGIAYVGEFSLYLSFSSAIIIFFMLSSKNFALSGFFDQKENKSCFVSHKNFRCALLIFLYSLSLVFAAYEHNILYLVLWAKFIDVCLDSMIAFQQLESKRKLRLAVILAVSTLQLSSMYFQSFSWMEGLVHALTGGVMVWTLILYKPSAEGTIVSIKKAMNSVFYQFSSTALMFLQRLFISSSTSLEILGFYSLLLQFVVFWSVFIQAAYSQFKEKVFTNSKLVFFFLSCALTGLLFISLLFEFVYLISPPTLTDLVLLLVVFISVYFELSIYMRSLKKNNSKLYLPNILAIASLGLIAFLCQGVIEGNQIFFVITASYLIRLIVFYLMGKKETHV